MSEREFDVVVLGAGPAGEVCAGRLGGGRPRRSRSSSPHLVGGECSFYACMPSKSLLRPGELLAEVRRIPGVREAVTGDLDARAVLERRDEIIHDLDDSAQVPWLEQRNVAVVRGAGPLDGERRVQVGDDTLVARKAVVVATGSSPLIPPIDGLREAEPWTNREATTAKEVPDRLAILGGGVVGVEMAQAYSLARLAGDADRARRPPDPARGAVRARGRRASRCASRASTSGSARAPPPSGPRAAR